MDPAIGACLLFLLMPPIRRVQNRLPDRVLRHRRMHPSFSSLAQGNRITEKNIRSKHHWVRRAASNERPAVHMRSGWNRHLTAPHIGATMAPCAAGCSRSCSVRSRGPLLLKWGHRRSGAMRPPFVRPPPMSRARAGPQFLKIQVVTRVSGSPRIGRALRSQNRSGSRPSSTPPSRLRAARTCSSGRLLPTAAIAQALTAHLTCATPRC